MNDTTTRDRLITDHLDIVEAIASRLQETLPNFVNRDDLIGDGNLGLIEAAQRFDASKGVKFSIYAKHAIRGRMLDGLRQADWASREDRKRINSGEREALQFVHIGEDLLEGKHRSLKSKETPPDETAQRTEMKGPLEAALAQLKPRYRQVLMMYHVEEMTMVRIGEIMGVNESRVSQINKAALAMLRKLLPAGTSVNQFV